MGLACAEPRCNHCGQCEVGVRWCEMGRPTCVDDDELTMSGKTRGMGGSMWCDSVMSECHLQCSAIMSSLHVDICICCLTVDGQPAALNAGGY